MKATLPLLFATGLLCMSSFAQDGADIVQMHIPSGPQLDPSLLVTDSSQGHWVGLKVQIVQADENGFEASCQASPENNLTIKGKFEKAGDSLRCSVKWEAAAELPEAFMMLLFRFPIGDFQDSVISADEGQGNREISMAKILEGVPTRKSFDNISAFSMGPVSGKTIAFNSDTPLGVEVIKTDTDFHIRFLITPRKLPLPASGSVEWSMSAQ